MTRLILDLRGQPAEEGGIPNWSGTHESLHGEWIVKTTAGKHVRASRLT
jgi:hypothetical protein